MTTGPGYGFQEKCADFFRQAGKIFFPQPLQVGRIFYCCKEVLHENSMGT